MRDAAARDTSHDTRPLGRSRALLRRVPPARLVRPPAARRLRRSDLRIAFAGGRVAHASPCRPHRPEPARAPVVRLLLALPRTAGVRSLAPLHALLRLLGGE